MKKIMFISTKIEDVKKIEFIANGYNIAKEAIGVINRDEAKVSAYRLQSASYWQRLDIFHSGEWGALIGFIIGLIISIMIGVYQPLDLQLGVLPLSGFVALTTLYGTWVGGMVGINHQNHKIAKFRHEIKKGKTLCLVDVVDDLEDGLKNAVLSNCANTRLAGIDTIGEGILNKF